MMLRPLQVLSMAQPDLWILTVVELVLKIPKTWLVFVSIHQA